MGDSPAEMEAAQTSTHDLACYPLIIKTVKFKEAPSSDELIEQLRILVRELPSIVVDERSSQRDLAKCIRPQAYTTQFPLQAPVASYAATAGVASGRAVPGAGAVRYHSLLA